MPIFPTGYSNKTTPVDNDKIAIADSAASNAIKSVTLSNLVSNHIKAKLQTLLAWVTAPMVADDAITAAKIKFDTFAGELLPDWSATPTSVTIPSGTVTDNLLIVLPEDCFFYFSVSAPTVSLSSVYLRAGTSTTATNNPIIYGTEIGNNGVGRAGFSQCLPAGTRLYLTKPSTTFNSGAWLPLKK